MENENAVPEITAANPDGGAERLNADPITSDIHDTLESLLDQAEAETSEPTPEPEQTNDDTNVTLENLGQEPDPVPVESPGEQSPGSTLEADPVREPAREIDPEILAIEQPRNLSEKNQNNWRKLQETASIYKKQAEEAEILRQRLNEMESRPAQTPQDYDELKKFRQIFDIKNDPEFQSKYTQPLSGAKDNIYGILKKHGASDDIIKGIEDAGGPDKVSDKWWQENALSKLPLLDAERLKRNLTDIAELKDKQESEVEYAAQNADRILEERQNQSKNWYQNETSNIRNYVEEITKEAPWARYQPIPDGATQEQIEKITAHNQVVSGLEEKFNSALWPTNANDRASVAAAAVLSHVLTQQLRTEQSQKITMQAELKRLSDENSKLKGASKMPRQNISTQSSIKNNSLQDRIKMNASDAIDMGLDEAGA
jgi:hypothetical protein